jgi:hypothetical protein
MEWHGTIFTEAQLVKIMVHVSRVPIHRPYSTWPLKILLSSLFDVTNFCWYIIHVIERHVAVIRLPSQYCEKGSGFEFLPQVSYFGPLFFCSSCPAGWSSDNNCKYVDNRCLLVRHIRLIALFNTLRLGHEETRDCSPMRCWRVTSFLVFLQDVLHMRLSAGLAHLPLRVYGQLDAGCLGLKLQINRLVLTPYF